MFKARLPQFSRRRMLRVSVLQFLLVLVIGCGETSAAEELQSGRLRDDAETEPLQSNEIPTEIHRLIKELGSPIYRNRQSAFLKLWEFSAGGRKSDGRRLIESATGSSDLDIAASARWLRVLMQLSTSPAEASRMIEELVLIRSGDTETLLRLARSHRWDHLLAMLDALSEEDRARLLSESEALAGPRAKLLMFAWSDHEEHRIPALVDHLWSHSESIEARWLWKTLGLDKWANQPPSFKLDLRTSIHWEASSESLNGRVIDAAHRARANDREDIANLMLYNEGLWEQAIPEIASQPPSPNSLSTGKAAVEAARTALLLQWSGKSELSQRWANAIGPPAARNDDVSGILLALCLCDRIDDALKIAQLRRPDEAYDCFLGQGRIEEALGCLGIEQLDEATVRDWVDGLLQKPLSDLQADTETTVRMAEVGSLFARLGLTKLASIVDQAAVERASTVRGDHPMGGNANFSNVSEVSRERWKTLFATWTDQKHHRRAFALTRFKKLLREGMDDELRDALLLILYGSRETETRFSSLAVPALLWFRQERGGDLLQASDDIEQLFTGRQPSSWPGDWHRDGLASLGRSLLHRDALESIDEELPMQLARLAMLHQRYELAKAWLSTNAEPGFLEWIHHLLESSAHERETATASFERSPISSNRLALLGEVLVHQNDIPRANVVFEKISKLHPDRIDLALRRSKLLKSVGETDRANHVRLQALSIPQATSEIRMILGVLEKESMHEEAELLLRHSLRSTANKRLDELWLSVHLTMLQHTRLTAYKSVRDSDLQDQIVFVRNTIDDDRRQLLNRLAIFPERAIEMRFSLSALEMLHRVSAHLAILEGDFEAADLAIRACHAANPDQIETPIDLIPMAEKKFGAQKTAPWIELYAGLHEEHLKRWPNDSLVGNNLAWLYANVDYRLDRALELSRHVAELLPDDSVYLDTLAEVEFRLGNIDKAIEISAECRRLSPLEKHHRTQFHRFLSAKSVR